MFDVFTEEIEVLIKDGIANLYWYRGDLQKAWIRAGVEERFAHHSFTKLRPDGAKPSKRQLMDELYVHLRGLTYNRRLEISRNFVRTLIEHRNFTPQSEGHRVEVAERAALKLRQVLSEQKREAERKDVSTARSAAARRDSYESQRSLLHDRFVECTKLPPHPRGTELEKVFADLVRISGIQVHEPFRIVGEQIDGALKYEGRYYLVELRWREGTADQQQIAGLFMKVEGKLDARGIFVAMNGYSREVLQSLPRGKTIKVILLDGMHLTNVLAGQYTLQQLLDHALSAASLRGEIYCSHQIP